MKPICVPCQMFYRPKQNDYSFVEGMPVVSGAQSGKAEPEKWQPYKLWLGDLWECRGCGAQIVVGTGRIPVSEHFKPDFKDRVTAHDVKLQVNDC